MTKRHADDLDIHMGAYVQNTDPGAVGGKKLWVDTTTGPPYALKVRKADNSGWDTVVGVGVLLQGGNAFGAPVVFGSTDAQDLSFIAGGSEWAHMYPTYSYPYFNVLTAFEIDVAFPAANVALPIYMRVNEAGGYSGNSQGIYSIPILETPTGVVDGNDASIFGQLNVGSSSGVTGPLLSGLIGQVNHAGSGNLDKLASVTGKAHTLSGAGAVADAISVYGALQTVGVNNWGGYFEGATAVEGLLRLKEIATPATPASGHVCVYVKSDHKLYRKDSTGTETLIG